MAIRKNWNGEFNKVLNGNNLEKEEIQTIDISKIKDYENQPFKEYTDNHLEELCQSIETNGLINPIILRKQNDEYIILSGHNRVKSYKKLGFSHIKAIVKENITDSKADLIMVESNLMQREELLPSEKAFAYKIQIRAKKELGQKVEDINSKDSIHTIRRYVRLTYLIDEFLNLIDIKQIKLMNCVELSYLSKDAQSVIYNYFYINNRDKFLDLTLIKKLRELEEKNEFISNNLIDRLIKKYDKKIIKIMLPINKIKHLIPDNTNNKETENYIIKALEFYRNNS